MSRHNERERAAPPAIYLIVAILAALAGFGTVYWSFAPSDNGRSGKSTPSATAKNVPAPGGAGAGNPLAGLNKGAMAPLVVRPQPIDLPDFTFAGEGGAAKSLKSRRETVKNGAKPVPRWRSVNQSGTRPPKRSHPAWTRCASVPWKRLT